MGVVSLRYSVSSKGIYGALIHFRCISCHHFKHYRNSLRFNTLLKAVESSGFDLIDRQQSDFNRICGYTADIAKKIHLFQKTVIRPYSITAVILVYTFWNWAASQIRSP